MSRVDDILAKYGAKRSGDMGNLGAASAASSRSDEILQKYGAKRSGDITYITSDEDEPSLLERFGNALSGAAKSTASGYASALGTTQAVTGGVARKNYLTTDIEQWQKELEAYRYKAKNADDAEEQKYFLLEAGKTANKIAAAKQNLLETETAGQSMQQTAKKLSTSAQQDIQEAKQGLGKVGSFLVDTGVAGAQMLGDVAVGALTGGSALPAMFLRSAGSSAQEAREAGGTLGQQVAYGLGSGALSVATEKLLNVSAPFKKAFGEGVLDSAITQATGKLGTSTLGKVALSAISEGGEEFAEALVQPLLQMATYDKNAIYDEEWLSNALHDAAIGAALGGIGGGVEAVASRNRTAAKPRNPAMPGAGEPTVEAAGTGKGNAESTVQGNSGGILEQEIERLFGKKNAAPEERTASYLKSYDPLEEDTIRKVSKKFTNLVVGRDTTISDFFNKWKNGRKSHQGEPLEKLYIGKVTDAAKRKLSDLLGYEVQSTDYIITADNVKHIMDHHGNDAKEVQRGNLPISTISMDTIADVVSHPDRIHLGATEDWEAARQAVEFEKDIGGGTVVYVQFDNFKRGTIEPRTLYIRKGTSTSAVNTAENAASTYTPKATEPEAPVNNVSQDAAAVKDPLLAAILQIKREAQAKAEADTDAGIPIDSPEGRQQFPYTNRVLDDSREGAGTARENAIGADGRRSIGSAAVGFTTAGMEGQQRTSRLAQSMPYDQYQEAATALSKEDYDRIFRYESQTEEKSLYLAEELLYMMKDGQRTFLKDIDEQAYSEIVRSLDEATAWNAPQTDAARMIAAELKGRSNNGEITSEEYVDFLRILREHTTSTGQGVQAHSKWSRTSNEGGTASELDAWENLEKSNLSDQEKQEVFRQVVKWDSEIETAKNAADLKRIIMEIANRRGVVNGVMGKQFSRIAESALDSLTTEQLRQFAYRSSSALTTDSIPTNWGQKAKTIQVLNMLSSPKTPGRNILGNTTFYGLDALAMDAASILDMAVAQVTGTRSVAGGGSSFREAVKAMRMSIAEITLDVDMGTDNRYTTGSNRTFKSSGNFVERVLSSLERNQAYLLNATDEFFKGAARGTQTATQKLVDQGKIKNTGKDYAKTQAEQLAKYRTFQDDSRLSVAIQQIHDILNLVAGVGESGKTIKGKTVHAFGAGDIVAPFTRVAGNLVSRGLDYSPLNVVKGTVEIVRQVANAAGNQTVDTTAQARGVSDLARGLTGTTIAYGFMLLAKAGLLRQADDEDDPDVAALNQSEGMRGTQLNLSAAQRALTGGSAQWQNGDILVDLASIQPLNTLMNLGTEMAKEEQNPFVSIFNAAKNSAMDAAVELPVMQTVGNMATDIIRYNEDPTEVILRESANTLASSVIPNALSGLAKGLDDRPRNTYADDALTGNIAANVKNRVPGLRQTLPGSVNSMGQEKVYLEGEGGIFNSLFNPIGVNVYDQSEVSREMERVREDTGNTSFYPSKSIPKTLTSDGETMALSYEERQQFQRERGTTILVVMSEMMGTSTYKHSGSEEQSALLDLCSEYAYQEAKAAVMGDDAVDSWVTAARDARRNGGLSTGAFLACRYLTSGLESDKDKDGNTISGSLKQKVMDKIDSMNISKQAKDYCFQQKYPKSDLKDTPWH